MSARGRVYLPARHTFHPSTTPSRGATERGTARGLLQPTRILAGALHPPIRARPGGESMMAAVQRFVSEEDGADLLEYAFVVGLVAMGCLVGMTNLAGS